MAAQHPHRGDGARVRVVFDYLEAMGTLAALRAVIDSAPTGAKPAKLVSAERKIARASRASNQKECSP